MTDIPANGNIKLLAKRTADPGAGAFRAALGLFERQEPQTLDEAFELVSAEQRVPPELYPVVAHAWDHYWHLRGSPCD